MIAEKFIVNGSFASLRISESDLLMVIANPAPDTRGDHPSARARAIFPKPNGARRAAMLAVILSAALAGCARNPAQHEFTPAPHEVSPPPAPAPARPHRIRPIHRHARKHRIRRADPSLLAPQPAPNCEFTRSNLKSVDPNEWGRLKVEFERQCYQDAEKVARDRLSQLQTSGACASQEGASRRSVQPR